MTWEPCIAERCKHHRGVNPNGHCVRAKVDASVGSTDSGWRLVYADRAGSSTCWHRPEPIEEQGRLSL